MSGEYLTPKEAEGYLTLRQAAEQLGLRPRSARKAAQRGTLRARKVKTHLLHSGYYFVVSEDEVERYRETHLGKVGKPGGPRTSRSSSP